MAIQQFSLNSVHRSDDVISIDDFEFIIFIKADFHPGVGHGLAQEQAIGAKAEVAPVVDLDQLCAFIVYVGLGFVIRSGACLVNGAGVFNPSAWCGRTSL